MSDTVVELLDVNGEWWNLTDGDRGVYLGTDPKGLYDPPVKVVYEEPGNYPGSRYLSHRILRRDITFGVEILNDSHLGGEKWISRDSEWRKAWSFDRDCLLHITTPESGARYLKIRLLESPEVSLYTDPNAATWNRVGMTCVAGDPFWYETEDVTYEAFTKTDTSFDPNPLPWPWPQHALPTETLFIEVDPSDGKGGLNPTDQPIFPKWIVPGSTEEPALPYIPWLPWLGAPDSAATIWTLPDYSFEDDALANRRLRLPGLLGGLRTPSVQFVQITGSPTGGSYTLTIPFDHGNETTASIAHNASAATIKTRIESLPSIQANDITINSGEANSFDVTFGGSFEGRPVPQMYANVSLTGGTYPYVNVQTRAEGYTAPSEDCVVDTDPRYEQIVSESGSLVWARMNGVRFRHPIPPYTRSKTFEITVTGAVPGQMIQLRLTRAWTRPWGLE